MKIAMHPATAFTFARIADDYARWRAVPEAKRSEMPAWWWAPALAARLDRSAMPPEMAAQFKMTAGARYADAAQAMLASLGTQTHQPWPEHFPQTYSAKPEDPAASAEPAAQAASAAMTPIG